MIPPLLLFQIPVILNAVGGILVGLVTSYAGGVRKVSVCSTSYALQVARKLNGLEFFLVAILLLLRGPLDSFEAFLALLHYYDT